MFSFTQLIKIFLFHLKIMFLNLDVFSRCTVHMQSLSLHMHIKYTASLLATHLQLYDFYYLALCIYIYIYGFFSNVSGLLPQYKCIQIPMSSKFFSHMPSEFLFSMIS